MKKRVINIFAIFVCFIALAAVGRAVSPNNLKIEIPFEFTVKDQKFPAGKYSIGRLNPADPDLLIMRNESGEAKILLRVQQFLVADMVEKPQLIFDLPENGIRRLTGIRETGTKYRLEIL